MSLQSILARTSCQNDPNWGTLNGKWTLESTYFSIETGLYSRQLCLTLRFPAGNWRSIFICWFTPWPRCNGNMPSCFLAADFETATVVMHWNDVFLNVLFLASFWPWALLYRTKSTCETNEVVRLGVLQKNMTAGGIHPALSWFLRNHMLEADSS